MKFDNIQVPFKNSDLDKSADYLQIKLWKTGGVIFPPHSKQL